MVWVKREEKKKFNNQPRKKGEAMRRRREGMKKKTFFGVFHAFLLLIFKTKYVHVRETRERKGGWQINDDDGCHKESLPL